MPESMERLNEIWSQKFEDTGLAQGGYAAPGRVNLIGEHTDYNDGFVLPMAIEREIRMFAQLRSDRKVRAYSLDYNSEFTFDLDTLDAVKDPMWANYLMGVASELGKAGYSLQGMNLIFSGDIPQGAGLSSSAALEVATCMTWDDLSGLDIDPVEMARLCQRAENNFVGVACGIMDQYISRLGEKDQVLFIDCRSEEFERVPFLDEEYCVVICDTGVQRGLVNSEYNRRRAECDRAANICNTHLDHEVSALRDVTLAEYENMASRLPGVLLRRARHVISENSRVVDSVEALKKGDMETFGNLMQASHESLRDDYEVSCDELDLLVELALDKDGVLGARMTGAGFGGCTVNLVESEKVEEFTAEVAAGYSEKIGKKPDIYVSRPGPGARKVTVG